MTDEKKIRIEDYDLTCPICGGKVIESPKSYSCENWKEGCPFTIWKESYGHKVSAEEAAELINGKMKGPYDLISKKGTEFTAVIYYNPQEKPNRLGLKFRNDFEGGEFPEGL